MCVFVYCTVSGEKSATAANFVSPSSPAQSQMLFTLITQIGFPADEGTRGVEIVSLPKP